MAIKSSHFKFLYFYIYILLFSNVTIHIQPISFGFWDKKEFMNGQKQAKNKGKLILL